MDAALRKKAAQRKLSLNQVIVEELSHSVGQKHADFTDLVGKWEDDPAFDENTTASQRKIDWAKWK